MRAPATLLKAGLSAAAAVVLLTACGGSDEEPSARAGSSGSGSSSSSSSAAAGSTAPSSSDAPAGGSASSEQVAAFCSQAVTLEESVNASVEQAASDPTQLGPALQRLADQYAAVEAPPEVAGDWGTLVDGIQQLAGAASDIDVTDPAAAGQLQASLGGLEEQLTTATAGIGTYAAANCGAAAPSS
ncbi:hypothetical protein [Modestobacter versicolor]|uniref:Uncharacterized protein n=1 Tax=Modestobacter versicolor TaxID=429133 RepID=A0A323VEW3_9ACTN|nr:hypothetical protein [Modestobacter versicolor]MBB3677824.1 hypothetical protein [Modestobacter versicolor]PZA22603.1 hypothetical protein DMO24_04120 [Modestobacter versicolor]